jgi:hypothetical protein
MTATLDFFMWMNMVLHIEGPRNVIADTFSRLLRKDVPSTLVENKAAHVVSNSELESLYF